MVMHHELSHSWFHRFSGGIDQRTEVLISLPASWSAATVPDVPGTETNRLIQTAWSNAVMIIVIIIFNYSSAVVCTCMLYYKLYHTVFLSPINITVILVLITGKMKNLYKIIVNSGETLPVISIHTMSKTVKLLHVLIQCGEIKHSDVGKLL